MPKNGSNAMDAPTPMMHLTGPKEHGEKLKGVGIGEEISITITGKVKSLSVNEYDASLGVEIETCEISQGKMTMTKALDKSERKRRGYAA